MNFLMQRAKFLSSQSEKDVAACFRVSEFHVKREFQFYIVNSQTAPLWRNRQLRCGVIDCCGVEVKKMEKLHFMNACKFEPGVFSCALDSFLEVWLRVVNDLFSEFSRCYVLRLLMSISGQFKICESTGVDPHDLNLLRLDLWDYIKQCCPSFLLMDCNAKFSEIFRQDVFTDINCSEQAKIISTHRQTAFCVTCQKNLASNSAVFVNYISLEDMLHFSYSLENWPSYIIHRNTAETLQCDQCLKQCVSLNSSSLFSEVMFVEFSPGFQSVVNFTEHISLLENNFQLYAMVRHLGSHFSCAVQESGLWFHIDDLQDNCTSFPTLQHLLNSCPTGWFFGVYKVTRAHEQANNTILDTASVSTDSNSLRRKLGNQSCDNITYTAMKRPLAVDRMNTKKFQKTGNAKEVVSTKFQKTGNAKEVVSNTIKKRVENKIKQKSRKGKIAMEGFPHKLSEENKAIKVAVRVLGMI